MKMRTQEDWDGRYRTGDLPWDTGRHDRLLEQVVREQPVTPCRALEIGCGTGTNALWLAKQGFEVTALDVSSVAINKAREKAESLQIRVEFVVADILADRIPAADYGFAFDRGCFHSFDASEQRDTYARALSGHLRGGGLWFSLIGSTDGPEREVGPPRRSMLDIAKAIEPYFEILWAKTMHFDSDAPDPPRAWACLMRKRDERPIPH